MRIVETGDHRQITGILSGPQPSLSVDHPCQFTQCHPVCHGQRILSDSRGKALLQDRPVQTEAVGIGSVQQDHLFPMPGAGIHQVGHGQPVGVKSDSHILDVNQQNIKRLHVLLTGIFRIP